MHYGNGVPTDHARVKTEPSPVSPSVKVIRKQFVDFNKKVVEDLVTPLLEPNWTGQRGINHPIPAAQ